MLGDSGLCLNPVKNIDIFILAETIPGKVQAVIYHPSSAGCDSHVSSFVQASAVPQCYWIGPPCALCRSQVGTWRRMYLLALVTIALLC